MPLTKRALVMLAFAISASCTNQAYAAAPPPPAPTLSIAELPPPVDVPADWWGFTPEYPADVADGRFDDVLVGDGRMLARLYWTDKQRSFVFHVRWVDVLSGKIVYDSDLPSEAAARKQMNVTKARPFGDLIYEDRSVTYFTGPDSCNWPLSAVAFYYDKASDTRVKTLQAQMEKNSDDTVIAGQLRALRERAPSYKILKRLPADREFELNTSSDCPRFEHGSGKARGHFEALTADVVLSAPDNTFIALLIGQGGGTSLVRFHKDLTSPFYKTTPDLAWVLESDELRAEAGGFDTQPESKFRLLDALFTRARAAGN